MYFFSWREMAHGMHHVNDMVTPGDQVSISGRLSLFSQTCPLLLNTSCTQYAGRNIMNDDNHGKPVNYIR